MRASTRIAILEAALRLLGQGDARFAYERLASDTSFADIRGVRHVGGPAGIGASQQGIFDSIYKGSAIRYEVESARLLGDGVVLANGRATLDAPSGPLAGIHKAVSTVVLVPGGDGWRAVAFHNELVTA